ncbi:MAG: Gfo/Idh/MocA family oxidoreductase [Candidatus Margulisiibacteriota bacterium]
MKIKVAIIGTGNIGKRHLQSLLAMDRDKELLCHDSNKGSIESVIPFCIENKLDPSTVKTYKSIDEILSRVDKDCIVIVATCADGRKELLAAVFSKNPLAVIAEKPLCQSEKDYMEIMGLARAKAVPVYVDLPRRGMEYYRKIREEVNNSRNMSFSSVFTGGLSCSGIHIYDLAVWLLDARSFEIVHTSDLQVFDTKRKGYKDISGNISVVFDGKKPAIFQALPADGIFMMNLSSEDKVFNIYEEQEKIVVCSSKGIEQRKTGRILISDLTGGLVLEIAEKGTTDGIPTIEQAYLAHRILFDILRKSGNTNVNIT